MDDLEFELRPVEEIPKRRRRSKYDPIIDEFLKGGSNLVEVEVEGKDPQYLSIVLSKRIRGRGLQDRVRVFQSQGKTYLERLSPRTP